LAEGSGHSVGIDHESKPDVAASPPLSRYVSAGATPAAVRTREVEERRAEGETGVVDDSEGAKSDPTASPAASAATAPQEGDSGAANLATPRAWVTDSTPKTAEPTTTDVSPMLPVATTPPPPKREKVPFWRRIAMQRSSGPALKSGSIEPLVTRIGALEQQISANHATTLSRLEHLEQNITRLWELEEQLTLTEVRERLAVMEANQEEIADSMHAVARNLAIVAVVLALAVAAGVFSVGIML